MPIFVDTDPETFQNAIENNSIRFSVFKFESGDRFFIEKKRTFCLVRRALLMWRQDYSPLVWEALGKRRCASP